MWFSGKLLYVLHWWIFVGSVLVFCEVKGGFSVRDLPGVTGGVSQGYNYKVAVWGIASGPIRIGSS